MIRDATDYSTSGLPLAIAPAIDALQSKIADLTLLEDDWNEEGSPPIKRASMQNASQLVVKLGRAQDSRREWLPDYVMPLGNGDVQLEWIRSDRELIVQVSAAGSFGYLDVLLSPTTRYHEEHGVAFPQMIEHIRRFIS